MAHALHGIGNGLFIEYLRVVQGNVQIKALLDQTLEHLQLDLPHDLHPDLLTVPGDVQLGVLLFQLTQLGKHQGRVRFGRELGTVGHNGLQFRAENLCLSSQALPCPGSGETGYGEGRPGLHPVRGFELFPGVQPQLGRLFRQGLSLPVFIADRLPNGQAAAGELHPGQPVSLGVPGDLVDPGREGVSIGIFRSIGVQSCQKRVNALIFQRRTKVHGEQAALGDQLPQIFIGNGPACQEVAHGRSFPNGFRTAGKIHAALAELLLQLGEQLVTVRPGQVHFIDKEKYGHLVLAQQLPQGSGVGLNSVCAADNQHSAVQRRQHPFRLRGKVHVARGVDQGHRPVGRSEPGLLGENGNAPLPFQLEAVQQRIPMVNPSQHPPGPGGIEQALGKGGLSRIHMGQQSDAQGLSEICLCLHRGRPPFPNDCSYCTIKKCRSREISL